MGDEAAALAGYYLSKAQRNGAAIGAGRHNETLTGAADLVDQGAFFNRARHQLRIHRRHVERQIPGGDCLSQGADAVIAGRVRHLRCKHPRLVITRQVFTGGTSRHRLPTRELDQQRCADGDCQPPTCEVYKVAVAVVIDELLQRGLQRLHPNVLTTSISYQLEHVAHFWHARFLTLDTCDRPLACKLIAQQFKLRHGGWHHVTLDNRARIITLVSLTVAVEQQYSHAWISWCLGDNGVRAQVRIGILSQHTRKHFAQRDTAKSAVQPTDIREQVVNLTIHHSLARGATAAVVLIGQALRF